MWQILNSSPTDFLCPFFRKECRKVQFVIKCMDGSMLYFSFDHFLGGIHQSHVTAIYQRLDTLVKLIRGIILLLIDHLKLKYVTMGADIMVQY